MSRRARRWKEILANQIEPNRIIPFSKVLGRGEWLQKGDGQGKTVTLPMGEAKAERIRNLMKKK